MSDLDFKISDKIVIRKKNKAKASEYINEKTNIIKIAYKCKVEKCKNKVFKVSPGCASKYCNKHLKDMEQICIIRNCNNEPYYGFDDKVLLCEIHRKGNKLTRHQNSCKYYGNYHKLCNENDCVFCFYRSLASYPYSENLCEYNANPRLITKSTRTKYYFKCEKCSHVYLTAIHHITRGRRCPYCRVSSVILCDDTDCFYCYNRTIETILGQNLSWSYKNRISSIRVIKNSNKKFWFKCNTCNHHFEARPLHINRYEGKTGCPYCGKRSLCEDIDCLICFNMSFASLFLDKFWSEKNNIETRYIFKATEFKYWFICEKGHNFYMSPNCIYSKGSWCPSCYKKTEAKVFKFLDENTTFKIEREARFDWCRSIFSLPFDFYIPSLNLIIEVDGPQHFSQIGNWKDPKLTRERDVYKMKLALEHSISVIRILQHDVYYNKYENWESLLESQLYKRDIPTVIYLDNDTDIYKKHIEDMNDSC